MEHPLIQLLARKMSFAKHWNGKNQEADGTRQNADSVADVIPDAKKKEKQ